MIRACTYVKSAVGLQYVYPVNKACTYIFSKANHAPFSQILFVFIFFASVIRLYAGGLYRMNTAPPAERGAEGIN